MPRKQLTVGSLFSGVGGIDLAFEQAGAKVLWQCEIDPHCQRVLRERWPDATLYDDVESMNGRDLEPVDVIVGGFPCQDVSVAGRRLGLGGKRSGLWSEFARLIDEVRPTWVLIENVVGLLSSRRGRDMGAVLGTLAELGYGYAYRVLDAQYTGVAQRRKRVFIVGYLGDGTGATEVLFDADRLYGDSPPSHPSQQVTTAALTGRLGSGGPDDNAAQGHHLLAELAGRYWDGGDLSDTLDVSALVKGQMMPEKRRMPVVFAPTPILEVGARTGASTDDPRAGIGVGESGDPMYTLQASKQHGVFIPIQNATRGKSQNGLGVGDEGDPMYTLDNASQHGILAFSRKNDGSDVSEVNPTLRSMNFDQSRTNGGGQVAVVGVMGEVSHALHDIEHGASEDGTGRGVPVVAAYRKSARARSEDGYETWEESETTNTLNQFDTGDVRTTTAIVQAIMGDISHALTGEGCDASEDGTGRGTPIIAQLLKHLTIRRITPLEGLRLQGFPDDHLEISGKPLSDTTKYRMIGNAVAVPCVRWIANRMVATHEERVNG